MAHRADPLPSEPAQQERTEEQLSNIARGGYVLKDCAGQPQIIFIATGSEVELAVAATKKLTAEGVKARVVSMPSTDAFDKQDAAYRELKAAEGGSLRVWRLKRVSLTTGSNMSAHGATVVG